MNNAEIADLFDQLADLLELEGANAFRVRAYRSAARTIDSLADSLADLVAEDPALLQELPGIGKDLAGKIVQILRTGGLEPLDELKQRIPADVVTMLRIPGLGPKKVAILFHELHLKSLDELKLAAEQGLISQRKGFGKKTEESILEGLQQLASTGTRLYLADAKPFADRIVAELLELKSVEQASSAGSVRRRRETIGDLDVLVAASCSDEAMDYLAGHPLVEKVLARGETKQRVRFKPIPRCFTPDGNRVGLEMDMRVVPEESFGAALQYFTGSKEHNVVTRRLAQQRGLKLNEYGLFRGEERLPARTEEEIYAALDLPWIPPELRENRHEFAWAEQSDRPALLELVDLQGDLHMHTTATDGTASIEEMIEAARSRGRKYIAITDHSRRVTMANGLDEARLRAHWREIRKLREHYSDIDVLCGIECDILEDATLDLPDDVLAEADWVIAVLHYGLKQPREQIRKRLLAAIRNPHVHLIGHPTGRLIGARPGAEVDFDDIFKAAADEGVMMEINAHPARLDLDDIHARQARDHGIPIVINTDAHSPHGLDLLEWGVYQARRAGLTRQDVANTRTSKEFRKLLR
ncbi:MAG: DNA polymerase/3'-5' exonuclease PolX [Planctomycetaceae bacterium]|nr:DNA polymerase/3'-5' exonuclease PolX [Planctomycetaceae bacterium]